MPGLDTCLFCRRDTGWEINGIAKFRHEGVDTQLRYRLACDPEWRTRSGSVSGYTGTRELNTSIERRTNAFWAVGSQEISSLEGCAHLDFGFTPATNFPQIRVLALKTDQSAHLRVAWLDMPLTRLQILEQLYERRTALTYWYEAPSVGYSGLLEITREGFIRRYPGLWELDKCERVRRNQQHKEPATLGCTRKRKRGLTEDVTPPSRRADICITEPKRVVDGFAFASSLNPKLSCNNGSISPKPYSTLPVFLMFVN